MTASLAMLAAFVTGGFPTGVLMSRYLLGKDVRLLGSRNPGAVNIWRVFGIKYALMVVTVDVGKGYLVAEYYQDWFNLGSSASSAALLGFCAVCGHCWSPFTHFHGGKGVGAALGSTLALYPLAALASIIIWLGVMSWTRIASLASIAGVIIYPLLVYLNYAPGGVEIVTSICLTGLVIFMHRSNLSRLRQGQELKFGGHR